MVEHTCEKCNKTFTKKQNYSMHIKRKKSCVLENDSKNKCNINEENIMNINKKLKDQIAQIRKDQSNLVRSKVKTFNLVDLFPEEFCIKVFLLFLKFLYLEDKYHDFCDQFDDDIKDKINYFFVKNVT